MPTVKDRAQRRKGSVRRAVKAAANGRKRLSVHRSGKHIYAQVIDDGQAVQESEHELADDMSGMFSSVTGSDVNSGSPRATRVGSGGMLSKLLSVGNRFA